MVDTYHRHGDFFVCGWRLLPELRVAECLRCAPEDFGWEAELGLVGAIAIEASGDVGEVVVALTVVAAAAAVGGVADRAWEVRLRFWENEMGDRVDVPILGGP